MPWRIALLAPLLVALIAALLFLPFLGRDREVFLATPQPPPLFVPAAFTLGAGERACAGPVPLSAAADAARIVPARIAGEPAAPLRVTVRAPGYAATGDFPRYADRAPLDLALPDPPAPADGELCVENLGDATALLVASTEDRTRGRLRTVLESRPVDINPVVSLLTREPAGLWERAATLTPGFAPGWVLLVLSALVVAGVPAAVTFALRRTPPQA